MKPVELPPEAEEQLGAFRALAAEAERMVASAQAQLREIAKQGEAETERAREVVHAMIDDKLVAAELLADAWADYELGRAGKSKRRTSSEVAPCISIGGRRTPRKAKNSPLLGGERSTWSRC